MNRHLFIAALAMVAMLSTAGCSGDGQPTTSPTGPSAAQTSASTASATPTASTAAPTVAAPPTTTQADPPSGGGGAPPPPPPPPPPDPNAAFCASLRAVVDRADQLLGPAVALDNSSDPATIEQAWQDIHRIAGEGAALSRQAIGQTDDSYLKSVAKVMATYFDQVVAAAAARDRPALDSISMPAIPEPPSGMQPPCQS